MELELHLFINSAYTYKAYTYSTFHQVLNLELGVERHSTVISKTHKEEKEYSMRLS